MEKLTVPDKFMFLRITIEISYHLESIATK